MFRLGELFDALAVAAVGEFGGEEDFHDAADLFFAEEVGAEAEDVAVIVLAGAAGGEFIVDEGGPDALHLVGGDGHTNAGAVHQDGDFVVVGGDRAGGGDGEVGVIARGGGFAAEILERVALAGEERDEASFGFVPAVVAGEGNSHEMSRLERKT